VAAGLVVLLAAGKVLSALTLRAAETGDPNLPITAQQAALRKVYRLVINLAGFYYYICLPFVILAALAIVAASVYVLLRARRIPGKALVVVLGFGVAMLAMIWASVKSLFVRVKDEDPGRELGEAEAPGLWALARDVAAAVGTRPVDEIWLTDGTELGVFERGGWWRKVTDRSRRALVLGEGVIDGFRVGDFRAVLAHEYGHFLHRDTAGGDVALRVNATMGRFATAMAQQGNLEWWNIGWQFLRVYHHVFRRITHGASRLQEINADRVAARLCGKEAFEAGLRHVVRRDLAHGNELGQTARRLERLAAADGAAESEPWGEAYTRAELRRQLDVRFTEVWERGTTADDTHPSPVERIRLLSRLSAAGAGGAEGGPAQCVDDLFADPARVRAGRAERQRALVEEFLARKRAQLTEVESQIGAHLRDHPGLTEPLVQRGQVRMELRDWAGAEADFSEAIRLDGPHTATAHYGRGCARAERADLDAAIADFRRSLELDASLAPQARAELADALFRAGRPAEAAAEYAALIAQTPDQLSLLVRRADALAQCGDPAGAEADYDKALALAPRCAEALAGRARVRGALGRRGEAGADARAALALEPGLPDASGLAELADAAGPGAVTA
jgi:tetratricopeptide (TPR) repeat protein